MTERKIFFPPLGGWVVRNAGNKAQLRPALAGALPELGNRSLPCEQGSPSPKK